VGLSFHKVDDKKPHHSHKLQGLPPVIVEPPPPPLRQRLDEEGSFETTKPQEIVPDPISRGENLSSKITCILELEA